MVTVRECHALGSVDSLRLRQRILTQQRDRLDLDAGVERKDAIHPEHAVAVVEVDLERGGLLERVPVVEVQAALGGAVQARRDDDIEALRAQLGCRVCA